MQFRYGSTTYTIHNKHSLTVSADGNEVRFSGQTVVTGTDSAINTAVTNLSTSYQDFRIIGPTADRVNVTNGSAWVVTASCQKVGDRRDTGKSVVLQADIVAIKAGARFTWGGTTYYVRSGSHTLTKRRAGKEVTFTGTIVTESAAAYTTAIDALATNFQDVSIEDPDGSSVFHTATNGATWVNTITATKDGPDHDESYAIRVEISSMAAGFRFTYNGSTYRLDSHTFSASDDDGSITFSGEVSDLTAAEYATAITTLGVNEANFTLEDITAASQMITITHSTQTGGVNTRAKVETIEAVGDSTARIRFTLVAQRAPQVTGRNGRRRAQIDIATRGSTGLRKVTLTGSYVGSAGTNAYDTYAAQVSTWITSVLNDIDSGATWQQREQPQISYDDNNGVLSFVSEHQEVEFPTVPNETSNATHRGMSINVLDPGSFGQAPLADLIFANGPARVRVDTTTTYDGASASITALHDYWKATIKPWVLASVEAATGEGSWIFLGPSLTIRTVDKRLLLSSQEMVSYGATRGYTAIEETERREDSPDITLDRIWSGIPYDRDRRTAGPSLRVTHRIAMTRIEQEPEEPPLFSDDWVLVSPQVSMRKEAIVDPRGGGDRRTEITMSYERTYEFAPAQSGSTLIAPAPLGEVLI